jgi:hypothetical protein
MKKYFCLFLLSIAISGCGTMRTKYQPQGDSGGYSEQKVDDKIMVARFAGNAHTSKGDASAFSAFRATEICKEQGLKIARLYITKDISTSQVVQKTSNYNYQQPTYVSGHANSNTNYNYYGGGYGQTNTNTSLNGTVSGGSSQGGSTAWQETYIYPTFDTYFSCTNQAFMTYVRLKEVSAEDAKPYVKDLMGFVQIDEIFDESPNKGILQVGDFMVKVNGNRIQSQPQYVSAIDASKDKNRIVIQIIRDGKPRIVNIKAVDATAMLEEQTVKIIGAVCAAPEVKNRPICAGRVPASK